MIPVFDPVFDPLTPPLFQNSTTHVLSETLRWLRTTALCSAPRPQAPAEPSSGVTSEPIKTPQFAVQDEVCVHLKPSFFPVSRNSGYPERTQPPRFSVESPQICQQPMAVGTGGATLPRWYYNAQTMQCVQFNYAGRMGNQNNFQSQQACEQTCPGRKR